MLNGVHYSKKVTRIEGVFSGTLSYIFNEFSTGHADGPSFSTVVRIARDKGYTVRPSLDSQSTNPDLKGVVMIVVVFVTQRKIPR
jgi:homoserine dehydrogenase